MKKKKLLSRTELSLIIIIIVYCAIVTFINPAFLNIETLFDILRSSSVTTILVCGITVVIISGGIDISFMAEALFGVYCATKIMITYKNAIVDNLVFALLISVTLGCLWGLFNALIISKLHLPAFIVTMGTQNLIFGFMTTFIGSRTYGATAIPKAFSNFASSQLFKIQTESGSYGLSSFLVPVVIVVALTWFVLNKTKIGRSIYALGNSEGASERIGINPLNIRFFVYGYMGSLAGVAGVVYVAQVISLYPNALVGGELSVIAAAVIGGTKLSGGKGKIFGAILGVLIVHLLNNTLIYLGLTSSWNNFFVGAVMIVSVATTAYQERVKNRKHFIFTE